MKSHLLTICAATSIMAISIASDSTLSSPGTWLVGDAWAQTQETESVPEENLEQPMTKAEVEVAQQILKRLGYRIWQIDGIYGKGTTAAVDAFYADIGVPAKKHKSLAVLIDLRRFEQTGSLKPQEQAGQSEATNAATAETDASVALEAETATIDPDAEKLREALVDTSWRLKDETGSMILITLEPSGKISGSLDGGDWRWKTTADTVELRFDAGLGLEILRQGKLSADGQTMVGTAVDSQGLIWSWQAEQLRQPTPGTS